MERGSAQERTLGSVGFESVSRFQARQQERMTAIGAVANHRQAQITEVKPDLVRAVGQSLAAKESPTRKPFESGHRGAAVFAGPRIHAYHLRTIGMRGDAGLDLELVFEGTALYQDGIASPGFFGPKPILERGQHGLILGQEKNPAGLVVGTMGVFEPGPAAFPRPRLAGRNPGMEQVHQAGPTRVRRIAQEEQVARFIQRQQALVLV